MGTLYYRNDTINKSLKEPKSFKFSKNTKKGFKLFIKYRIFDAFFCWPLISYAPNAQEPTLFLEQINKTTTELNYEIKASLEKNYIIRDRTQVNNNFSELEKKIKFSRR